MRLNKFQVATDNLKKAKELVQQLPNEVLLLLFLTEASNELCLCQSPASLKPVTC